MAGLPTSVFDKAIPGEDYPFKIIMRGGDVPATDDYAILFKGDCQKTEVEVSAVPLAADPAGDPPLAAGKQVSGFIDPGLTAKWYGTITWMLIYRVDGKPRPLIGGTFQTEFEGMLT